MRVTISGYIPPKNNATIVLDRPNVIYGYCPLDDLRQSFLQNGFQAGPVTISVPHTHYYHPEFDEKECEIVQQFPWKRRPLRQTMNPKCRRFALERTGVEYGYGT